MSLFRPSEVSRLLSELDLRPSRSLGQNFLIDGNILDILIRAAEVAAGDRILEIGPGLGALTERLLEQGAIVCAVEKDPTLHAHVARTFQGNGRLALQLADALAIPPDDLLRGIEKVVSNLPYASGSRMLIAMAQSPNRPRMMVVTVQKEVAARLVAPPGSRVYGLLGLWLQADYDGRIVHTVRAACFHPRPAVDSAVVRLVLKSTPLVNDRVRPCFYLLTKRAFEHRRKRLSGALDRFAGSVPGFDGACDWAGILEVAGIEPDARPEDVGPSQWAKLASLAEGGRSDVLVASRREKAARRRFYDGAGNSAALE